MKPMKNNRGFTLIELIVVMVIMGIVAVGSVTSYHILDSRSSKNATERIQSVLDYVQMENMTKKNTYSMRIAKDSASGNYKLSVIRRMSVSMEQIEMEEILELKNGELTFQISGDATQYLVSSLPVIGRQVMESIEISFRKDTGGLNEYTPGNMITRIGITSSGRTHYIRLVATTGKHFIE
jgi:prepilin-type N-terminal cleavage/methylation domain-containing protein